MYIGSLELKNFRNYIQESFAFEKGTNILYGDNAQGKTNVLEALMVCATTRSPRGSHDSEMIRFGEDEAHIRLSGVRRNVSHRIDTHLRRSGKKGVAVDGIPIRKASEVFGYISIVSFFPEDLRIIKNSPKDRRRFLDSRLCQIDRSYFAGLAEYNRAVAQRNALLKDQRYGGGMEEMLDVWDEQLVSHGAPLIRAREAFLLEMDSLIRDIHRELTRGKEELTLTYEPSASADGLAEKIRQSRDKDLRWKASSAGPHRDDFRITVNDSDIRVYGSQGQQRSAALSLKLAEIEMARKKEGDDPILLLDDVLPELDSERQEMLLRSIKDTQTFITCTGMDDLTEHDFPIDRVFHIKNGEVEKTM